MNKNFKRNSPPREGVGKIAGFSRWRAYDSDGLRTVEPQEFASTQPVWFLESEHLSSETFRIPVTF